MLLDSNIIIYAAKPEHAELRQLIAANSPAVSVVSMVEVLGYHRLTDEDRKLFEEFFAAASVLPISDAVVLQAIKLRQCRKMTLGDSLVAATCLVHGRKIVTRNSKDFADIPGLQIINPFGEKAKV
jgi:toxin FitB